MVAEMVGSRAWPWVLNKALLMPQTNMPKCKRCYTLYTYIIGIWKRRERVCLSHFGRL